MADVSQVKLPNGDIYDIKDDSASTATNWVNGSTTNSVRTTGSAVEDSSYTIGAYAVAEGYGTKASGTYSHAEGASTTASNTSAHAEGSGTTASGIYSHAEGYGSTSSFTNHGVEYTPGASGQAAHVEGSYTAATANSAHAEGYNTVAAGIYSHAGGYYTVANHKAQHVFGEYNIADPSTASASNRGNYVEIVGNGTSSSAYSNARTLDWSGNEVLAGKLTVGVAGTNSMDVATVGQIPTVPSNIVNTITTTAGAHTAITSQKGNVSFNVPTTAAHVGIKFGYTTSGNNRAVLQDSNGNLYVVQKDDNTWRGIQNNLTSTSTTDSLSAYQGKILNESKLSLTGGNVTGPVNFGDSVSIDDLNAGQLVVSGNASVTNNLQVNTINGVVVGSSPKFTDTKAWGSITGKPTATGSNTTGITASTTATKTTLGTANSIYGVSSTTTTASKASGSNGTASSWTFKEQVVVVKIEGYIEESKDTLVIGTAVTPIQSKTGGSNGTAPTWSFTDVTVPIKNSSATSIPNVSVTSATVSITDNGHTHSIS